MATTNRFGEHRSLTLRAWHWWGQLPEGWLIQRIFALMASGCVIGMVLDATGYTRTGLFETPAEPQKLEPVDIDRPEPGDNLRPYQPGMVPRPTPFRPAQPSLPDGTPLSTEISGRMQFAFKENHAGVPFIVATGNLDTGTAEEFSRFDETHDKRARYLFLVSHGGLVLEALRMGQYVRDREMKTVVPREGFCFSACPLVLAGGVERVAYPDSWVGLHQIYLSEGQKPSADEAFETGQRSVSDIMGYLEKLDVDPLVWRLAIETPPDQIHMLSKQDLLETKLTTIVSPNIKLK